MPSYFKNFSVVTLDWICVHNAKLHSDERCAVTLLLITHWQKAWNWIGVKISSSEWMHHHPSFILWKIDFHACYFISSWWKTSLKTFFHFRFFSFLIAILELRWKWRFFFLSWVVECACNIISRRLKRISCHMSNGGYPREMTAN